MDLGMASTNNTDIISHFFEFTQKAEFIEKNHMDVSPEKYFDDVLAYVMENLDYKADFCTAFIDIVRNPDLGSVELVQYCMHVLRWQELKEYFTDWLNKEQSERARHVLRRILEAFDDDWFDARMYERFREK